MGMEGMLRQVNEFGAELPDRRKVMGYGPARFLTVAQVREVADALANCPAKEKASEFDSKAAEEKRVYVPGHDREELLHYFGLLRDFYRDAAEQGHAVLGWVE